MPRLFYPPLVEPGVYIKPKGIQLHMKALHRMVQGFYYTVAGSLSLI